jgi:hypothetical protein
VMLVNRERKRTSKVEHGSSILVSLTNDLTRTVLVHFVSLGCCLCVRIFFLLVGAAESSQLRTDDSVPVGAGLSMSKHMLVVRRECKAFFLSALYSFMFNSSATWEMISSSISTLSEGIMMRE